MMPGLSKLRIVRCFALLLTGAFLLAWTFGAAGAEPCNLSLVTELPLEGSDIGSPIVKILVDNQPRRMLLDTGGFWSLLDPGLTAAYKHTKAPVSGRLGLKGIVLDTIVRVPSIQIGIVLFKNNEFYVAPSEYGSVDGTLGANWLQGFDVEIDPARNMARMFVKNRCEGAVIYWPHDDAAEIPIHIDRDKRITIPVVLNGQEIEALIDTGSSETILNLRTAGRLFDLTPESPGMQVLSSRTDHDGATRAAYRYQFKSLMMGDIGFGNPWVVLAPMSVGGPDMILGMHHLHGLHLYFAYGQHKLYVTTGRGDIAVQQAAGDTGQKGAAAAAAPALAGTDPMARVNAKNFVAEAAMALKKGDRAAAAAAVDKALKLDPSYPAVYLTRARLRFEQGDRAQAMADLAEAAARAPDDVSVLGARADIYGHAGEYTLAYADIDRVLHLNPPTVSALNGRCWFGAHLEKYEAALADCDAALALDKRSPSTLDSRGYIYLKTARPDLAIAEYNKALRANRNSASAYYGRALAEQQKGEKSDSEDDMATARKIDPDIDKTFGK